MRLRPADSVPVPTPVPQPPPIHAVIPSSPAPAAAPRTPPPPPEKEDPLAAVRRAVKEQIQDMLYKQKFEKIFQEYIDNLRSKAVIEVKL